MPVQTQILTRRGTAASWTSTNPTLGAGEIGFETDTGNFKIGNGSTAWASLAYNLNGGVSTSGGSTITVASGSTVPLTIQNNGTGNSFVVNDVASDTSNFVIDAAGAITSANVATFGTVNVTSTTASTNGIYLPAANTLDINTNSTRAIRVSSTQQVGIGVTPTTTLDVTGTNVRLNPNTNATSNGFIFNGASGNAAWASMQSYRTVIDGATRFEVLGSGITGIGAAATTAQLLVNSVNTGNIVTIIKGAAGQTAELLQVQNSAGTVLFEVDSVGNVGIGTATPAVRLDVRGVINAFNPRDNEWDFNAFDKLVTLRAGNDFFGSEQGLEFTTDSQGPTAAVWAKSWGNNYNSGRLTFLTKSSGSLTQKMTITESGDVGIGTTTPTAKLDVNGSIKHDNQYEAGKNKIINGDFAVWQRGTTFTNPSFAAYTSDRWRNQNYDNAPTTYSITRETFTPGTAPIAGYEGQYFFRSTLTTIGSCTVYDTCGQRIEGVLASNTSVTLSFWAKSDSNRTQSIFLFQNYGSGGSGDASYSVGPTFSTTTAWQRFTFTATSPNNTGKTIGANAYAMMYIRQAAASGSVLDVWGVQVEYGSVATPFQTATGTIQGELAACQRYYFRSISTATNALLSSYGMNNSTTLAFIPVQLPTTMRTKPASVDYANIELSDFVGEFAISALVIDAGSTPNIGLVQVTSTGLTQYRPNAIRNDNNAAGYIAFISEL